MDRRWAVATIILAATITAFAGYGIYAARNAGVATVEERTRSISRMIAAHAEASIGHAEGVLNEIETRIANWDFEDQAIGRAIFEETRGSISHIPAFSSAWIVDAQGISRFDTWTFPARPVDASERPYFKAHLAGGEGMIILGDPQPGAFTGRERFTISRAQRGPDGTLRSIVVVAIYSHVFDALYEEVANWPDARGGLYSIDGDVLARLRRPGQASPEFIEAVQRNWSESATGTAILSDAGMPRLVSWHRLAAYPHLYGATSQTITTALTAGAAGHLSPSASLSLQLPPSRFTPSEARVRQEPNRRCYSTN